MNEAALGRIVQERLQAVEERLTKACRRSGRSRADVTLVAVTKTVSPALAALLPKWGIGELGENRPQELLRKVEHWRNLHPRHESDAQARSEPEAQARDSRHGLEPHWHMIGHLQRNKIDRILPLVRLIHSVDSVRLLHAIEAEAARQELRPEVLLQFNTSDEESKQGFEPAQIGELSSVIVSLEQVQVRGLMTMAALQEPEACRPSFIQLRKLAADLAQGVGRPLRELSMGMTNDFEIAVEEGATLVRLGTVLFGGLENEPT